MLMESIQIFGYQREKLEQLGKIIFKETVDQRIPFTYAEVVGELIRVWEEREMEVKSA